MNSYQYRIFYEYQGPSHVNQLGDQLEPDAVIDALRNFPQHLEDHVPSGSVVEVGPGQDEKSRIVTVKTLADKESVDSAVARCLDSFKLLGKRL